MKAVHWLGITLALTATALPAALARPPYRVQAITQFGLDPDKDGKPGITCQYCHQNAGGGKPWNKFGDLVVEQFFGEANKNISQALYLALQKRQDSDGDGYVDVLEVVAKTLPGDAKSTPKIPKDTLEAELKAWGGLKRYQPKAR